MGSKKLNYKLLPQFFKKFPINFKSNNSNYKPINESIEHRQRALKLYKNLLILSNKLDFLPYKEFCLQHIRNRFRFFRAERDYKKVWGLLQEGERSKTILEKCLLREYESLKLVDDLVWGRKGFLKDKLKFIESHKNFNKEKHRMISDLRSNKNKIKTGNFQKPLTFDPMQFAIKTKFPKKERPLQPPSDKVRIVKTNYGITFLRFIGRPIPHWFSSYINKKIYREVDRRKNLSMLNEYKLLMSNELEFEKSLGLKADEGYLNTINHSIDKIQSDIKKMYELSKRKESIKLIQPSEYVRDINPRLRNNMKAWPKPAVKDWRKRYN